MKQLIQRLDDGTTHLLDVPVPRAGGGSSVVVRTRATVISPGTERMLVDFGRSSLFQKARSQPDRVRQVVEKARTEGLVPTIEAVRSKLETPLPLGYCNAGTVVEAGPRSGFRVGERVVTNGPHAEYVRVTSTMAARIPEGVGEETAAFTPLAAIALQGLRLASPTMGETFVVYGLGLIGLLTVQLVQASGCRAVGIDPDPDRRALARDFGADVVDAGEGVVDRVLALNGGRGVDGVLLTLASSSDEPVHRAAEMSRKRGRLVLVGVTGLNLRRDDFYAKELSFQVSCSYGPGRYDPRYEEAGEDYPLPYVRWTEQRNFEAVLQLMAEGKLRTEALVTHRVDFTDAPSAYDLITNGGGGALGIVLTYPEGASRSEPEGDALVVRQPTPRRPDEPVVGVIGAGNYAVRTLLPALKDAGAHLHTIVSRGGTSAAVAARKFGFERVSSDTAAILDSEEVNTVFVLTRHDSHASLAVRALESGKHVFVEKPVALTESELASVQAAAERSGSLLMVGFNRRFAPLTAEARQHLARRSGPLAVVATISAGAIPPEHWTQDPLVGGGRIVGEACHWIDLARHLVGAPITGVQVVSARDSRGGVQDDISHITLSFADGSVGAVNYLANASAQVGKERIECHFDGRTLVIDNWRKLRTYGVPGRRLTRKRRLDKGQDATLVAWLDAVRGGTAAPIPLNEVIETGRWSMRAAALARGAVPADE